MTDHDDSGGTPQDQAPPASAGADVVSIDDARKARQAAWPEAVKAALEAAQTDGVSGLLAEPVLALFRTVERESLPQWVEVKAELKRIKAPLSDIIKAMRAGGSPAPRGGGAGPRKKEPKSLNFGDMNVLLEHFALLYGTDTVMDMRTKVIMRIGALRLAFGTDTVKLWLGSRERYMVPIQNVVFEPGQELGREHINLFDGLPVEPVAGDCSVMLELLQHLCSESAATDAGVAEVMDQVLAWIAYPLQHVGAKLHFACVFHGAQGTGKNLFWDVVRDLYGDYGVMVSQNELEDKFTSWLSRKMFIVGDEVVTRAEMYHKKNQLKWIVTSDKKIPIRAMQQDVRWESNHAQVVFLSNESQPLALEEGDRRYLVIYTPLGRDDDLYVRVRAFLEAGGARHFLHYLLRLELGDFGPGTKPIMTKAKQDLIELGLRPAQRFAHEWFDGLLSLPVWPCSAEQLYRAFKRWVETMGERFPPAQAEFTRTVERWAMEKVDRDADGTRLPPRLHYKVVSLTDEERSYKRSRRCWIPRDCRPPPGVTEGQWMADNVEAFEREVTKYCRNGGREEGES